MSRGTASVGRASITNVVGSLFPPATTIVTAPILAQALGVDGRGEVAAAIAPLTLILTAGTFGIPEALTFVTARSRLVDVSTYASARACALVLGCLWVIGVVGFVSVVPIDNHVKFLMVVASCNLPPAFVLALLRARSSGLGDWRRVANERMLSSVCRLFLIGALFAAGNLTVTAAVVVNSCTLLLGYVAYRGALCDPRGSEWPRGPGQRTAFFRFGLSHWSGSFSGALLSRLDQVLMVSLVDLRALGLYAVAVSLSETAIVVNLALRDVMYASESRDPSLVRLTQAARISTMATAVLCGALCCVTYPLLPILFGREFAGAWPCLVILSVGILLGNPGSICGAGLGGWGRPGLRSASMLIAAIVSTAALLVLAPRYGAIGASVATVVGNVLAGNLNIVLFTRAFGGRRRDFYLIRQADIVVAWRIFARRGQAQLTESR